MDDRVDNGGACSLVSIEDHHDDGHLGNLARGQRAGLVSHARRLEPAFEVRCQADAFGTLTAPGFYNEFFQKCYELLSDDGVFLLHSCGRSDGPGITNPWLEKYIFPGGYIPALSEVLPAIERAGFLVTDIEILRLHYADTLREWRERFLAKRGEVSYLYDERFCRMWELYLVSSEMAFREEGMMVFQIQMTKTQGVVPNTRNYILESETNLRGKETSHRIDELIA